MDCFKRILLSGWQKPNSLTYSLLPLSLLYLLIIKLRQAAYHLGFLKSKAFNVPVIVVGNITVGGTGKTPMVIFLVEYFREQGYKPGVTSRGYGGQAASWPQSVDLNSDPAMVGDEPVLIARRTECPLVVGPKRTDNITVLLEKYDCDLIISDDGLQHYAMQRDIEIIITDKTRVETNYFLLPAGPYRELKNKLKQCELSILHVDTDNVTNNSATNLTADHLTTNYSMQLLADKPIALTGKHKLNATNTLHAVAGIGNPERFFKTCEQAGYTFIKHVFADHYQYKATDINFTDNLAVLMTEKDAVKCFDLADKRHYYLPVSAKLSDNFLVKLKQLTQEIDK